MKKRYLTTILLLLFFNISTLNAKEIYYFDSSLYSEEEFEEIFLKGCDGTSGTSCYGTCSNGVGGDSTSITIDNNPCGGLYEVKKFRIGDGSEETTKKILGQELFNKYVNNDVPNQIPQNEEKKEETGYYFEQGYFKTDEEFNDFFMRICTNETACYGTCSNGVGGDSTSITIDNNPCGSLYGIKKFRIGDGSIKQTIQKLHGTKCSDNENCLEYVSNNYCSGYDKIDKSDEKYKLCNAIKDVDNQTGTCSYVFKTRDGKNNIAISGEFTTDKKDLIFNIKDNDFFSNGGTFDGEIISAYNNKLHFYAKGQDFNSFKNEYIKKYNKDKTCPILCFGYDINDTWYTAFSQTEFEDQKYKLGYVQCSSGGKTTVKGAAGDITLITGKKITFENCEELFEDSPELLKMIKFVLNIIKIGIPIVLIGLGMLDFAKAIFAGKEDEMKKAQSKFIKRIIIGVCIFLVPIILKLILTIGNSVWGNISADFCGIL